MVCLLVDVGEAKDAHLTLTPTNVVAEPGQTVPLTCEFEISEYYKVYLHKILIEWVKYSDVGFESVYETESYDAMLLSYPMEITNMDMHDAGTYYCQVTMTFMNGYTMTYHSNIGEVVYSGE